MTTRRLLLGALLAGAATTAAGLTVAETEPDARLRAQNDYLERVARQLNAEAGSGWSRSPNISSALQRSVRVAGTPIVHREFIALTPMTHQSNVPLQYSVGTFLDIPQQTVIVSDLDSHPQFRHQPHANNNPLSERDLAIVSFLTSNIPLSALTNDTADSENTHLPREIASPLGPIRVEYPANLDGRFPRFLVMGEHGVPMAYSFTPDGDTPANGNRQGVWSIRSGIINEVTGFILPDGRVMHASYVARTRPNGLGLTEDQFTPAQRQSDAAVGQNPSIVGPGTTRQRMGQIGRIVYSVPRPNLAPKSVLARTLGL